MEKLVEGQQNPKDAKENLFRRSRYETSLQFDYEVNSVELAEKKLGGSKKIKRINAIKLYQKTLNSSFSLQNCPLTNTSGIMQAQDLISEDVGRKKYKKIGYFESIFSFC